MPLQSTRSTFYQLPSGLIMDWTGAENEVPAGFALCNGENGTPDLSPIIIEPDSSTDESGLWSNETNTSAESISLAYEESTEWIDFNLTTPQRCCEIYIDVSRTNEEADPVTIEVEGYWSGAWHALSGTYCWVSGLQKISLPTTIVLEKIRLRFRNDDYTDSTEINVNDIRFGKVRGLFRSIMVM